MLPDQTLLYVQGYFHPVVVFYAVISGGAAHDFSRLKCKFLQLVQDATLLPG